MRKMTWESEAGTAHSAGNKYVLLGVNTPSVQGYYFGHFKGCGPRYMTAVDRAGLQLSQKTSQAWAVTTHRDLPT